MAGILAWLLMTLYGVYGKWYALYVLRVAPEYHLVTVKALPAGSAVARGHADDDEQLCAALAPPP